MKQISVILAVAAFLLALHDPCSKSYAGEPQAVLAPVNPRFLHFVSVKRQSPTKLKSMQGGEKNGLGYIPGPVDYSYLKGQRAAALSSPAGSPRKYLSALNVQYDLRQQNKLTPVRNQGTCGS